MNLFDSDMTPADAARFLTTEAAVLGQGVWTTESVRLALAIGVVLEDRERLKGIAGLAEAVRTAQKRYFRDRTDESLQTSKDLERRLDKMLADA